MGTVVRVVDGSTLDIEAHQGSGLTLLLRCRLDGVVVPGLDHPDPEERTVAEHAKDFVEVLVLDKEVAVRLLQGRTDEQGRWPAAVFWRDAEGTWSRLNEDLVENGLAALVPPSEARTIRGEGHAREAVA